MSDSMNTVGTSDIRPMRLSVIGLRGVNAAGGVETAVRELYPHLVKRGWDVTVYARSRYEPKGAEYDFRVRRIPSIYTRHLEALIHTGLCTLDALRRGTDLIHYHSVGNALWLWVPRVLGVPTVVTVHGLDWERRKWGFLASRVLRIGGWLAARLANQVIGVSKKVADDFDGRLDRSLRIIPNGVPSIGPPADTQWLTSKGLERRFILFLGRLVPEKGVTTLLRAFRQVDLPVDLVIAGEGTHTARYVARVRELAEEDSRVMLVGPRFGREKSALLAGAAVFALPSELEGMPITLLEAMDRGIPCVVSDIPEILEVVGDPPPPRAFVFTSGDEGDLALQLQQAFSDGAQAIGLAGQTHVRASYDWKCIAAQTDEVYRAALAGTN